MKIRIIFMLVFALMLGSCATYQKKLNKFQTFALNNPAELAKLCVDKFPPKTVTKPGRIDTVEGPTVYIKGDSIPCPDGTKVKTPDKQIKCPPSIKCTPDTVYTEDTGKLFLALGKIDELSDSLSHVKGELKASKENEQKLEKKGTKKDITIVLLIVAIGVAGVLKFKGIL